MRRREFIPLLASPVLAQPPETVERWGVFEFALRGPADLEPTGLFRHRDRAMEIEGFHDGDGQYRIRFSPDREGPWEWTIRAPGNPSGRFLCTPPSTGNHGPVSVKDTFHFAHADGTPYKPFGTTCYAWIHQTEELERQTLATLRTAPFNKMRMCVFPKHYAYNANEPRFKPFAGTTFDRFDPAFFRHLEQRVLDLQRLGIEADLILFHPYDRWGYANMGAVADQRYLRYVVARLGAYRNVWWSMANEYNFVKTRPLAEWETLAATLKASDPYGRLCSIHNGGELENMYDHSRSWITHVSLQSSRMAEGRAIREKFRKPVLYDECRYEGNLPKRWGDISARELLRNFWLGTVEGCYVGHGETYLDPNEVIWWSKGGALRGESPPRIAFLRKILEEGPKQGLTPIAGSYYPAAAAEGEYYLYYFDVHQPAQFTFPLPKTGRFRVDLIDPWEMTITPAGRDFTGEASVKLPARPHLAARLVRL